MIENDYSMILSKSRSFSSVYYVCRKLEIGNAFGREKGENLIKVFTL